MHCIINRNEKNRNMKRTAVIIALLALCTPLVWCADTIRVVTINIHQGSDTTLQFLGQAIGKYNPDLVAVQEVDMYPQRPEAPRQSGKNFIAELGFYADMQSVFGKAWDHPGGWDYGDAILSKHSFSKSESFILKHQDGTEPRQLLLIHTRIKGHDICFACTHLCHQKTENRAMQLRQIKQIMRRQKEKLQFVCGDLNSDNKENIVHPVMKGWKDALPDNEGTFSSMRGKSHYKAYKYDYILYKSNRSIEVIQYMMECDAAVTDHCICIADIVIN